MPIAIQSSPIVSSAHPALVRRCVRGMLMHAPIQSVLTNATTTTPRNSMTVRASPNHGSRAGTRRTNNTKRAVLLIDEQHNRPLGDGARPWHLDIRNLALTDRASEPERSHR